MTTECLLRRIAQESRCIVAALTLFLVPAVTRAQTATEVLAAAKRAAAESARGIADYTLVEDVNGVERTRYCKLDANDRSARYACRVVAVPGVVPGQTSRNELASGGSSLDINNLKSGANVIAVDTTDQRVVFRIPVDPDSAALAAVGMSVGGLDPGTAMTLFIDRERQVLTRIDVELGGAGRGAADKVRLSITYGDFRNTEGFVYPFLTIITVSGGSALPLRGEAGSAPSYARNLARLPRSIRSEVEAKVRKAVAEGSTYTVLTVTSLKVNSGPPR